MANMEERLEAAVSQVEVDAAGKNNRFYPKSTAGTKKKRSGRVYLLPQAQSSPHLFSGVHWQLSPQEQSLPQRHSSPQRQSSPH